MFVCMDAIRRERLSLGELSPVGRLRGVGVMYMSYFVVTPLRHRCAMPPLPKERLYIVAGRCASTPPAAQAAPPWVHAAAAACP